jgi:hypothetical protein
MVDRLSAVSAGVDHGAIALRQSFGTRDLGSCPVKVADQGAMLLACMGNGRDVLTRNNEDVHRRLRIDVAEGVALLVLKYGVGRDASFDDPAKEAAHFGFSLHERGRFGIGEPTTSNDVLKDAHGGDNLNILAAHLKGRDDRGHAACVVWLEIPVATLLFPRCFGGVKKAVNRAGQGAIESAERCKGYIDKPMPASPFHQLGNAAAMIDSHDDEQACSVGHLDNFPQ